MVENKKIMKTYVFSRHTLRKPLFQYMDFTDKLNKNNFHIWEDDDKEVTKKGVQVENELDKILKTYYPDVITNYMITCTNTSRTRETAMLIAKNTLNIKLDLDKITYPDKIFNVVTSKKEDKFLKLLESTFKKLDNEDLKKANKNVFDELIKRDSNFDMKESEISFSFQKDAGFPKYVGGQADLFHVTDIFYSEFYEGKFPYEEIVKFRYNKEADLTLMSKIKGYAHYLSYKMLISIKDLLRTDFLDLDIYVGHDVNIVALATALELDVENLPNAVESAPIGTKFILTEVIEDEKTYIEIHYLYMDSIKFKNPENVLLYKDTKEKFLEKLNKAIDLAK